MVSAALERERARSMIPARPDSRTVKASIRNHATAFLICLLLAFVFTLPGSLSLDSALLGYPGDNFQHAWFLWHFARAIAHLENPFHTYLLFFPGGANLTWSTTDPLAGLFALPISLTAGPTIAYNLSVILQLALSAFFARLLCFRVSRDETAALFGGFIFGFSPFFLAHALGHLSLITSFPIPLFVLILDRIFSEPSPSWKLGLALGGVLLLAAFAHYDYAVLCILFGFVWFLIELGANLRLIGWGFLRRTFTPLCVGAAAFLAGFSRVLWMLAGKQSDVPASRGLEHVEQYSADALGFLVPSWNHVLWGRFVSHWDPALFSAGFEGTVYVGIVVLALAAIGWRNRSLLNQRWANRALLLGLTFYLFSLGPHIRVLGQSLRTPGPAALFYHLPFARFISAPARFQAVVAVCVAVLASLGVKFLTDRYPKERGRFFVVSGLAILLICDYLTIPFPRSSIVDPAAPASSGWFSKQHAEGCALPGQLQQRTILTFPLVVAPYCMKSMWMQVRDGGRYALVDGYLSYTPKNTWETFWDTPILRSLLSLQGTLSVPVNPLSDRESARSAVRDLNLGAVVVFDSPQRYAASSYISTVFGTHGERAGTCTVFPVGQEAHTTAVGDWTPQRKDQAGSEAGTTFTPMPTKFTVHDSLDSQATNARLGWCSCGWITLARRFQ